MTAPLEAEVTVAEADEKLLGLEVVKVGDVEAAKAIMPWVVKPSDSSLPLSSAQVEGSRPLGQQKLLTRQEEPAGHASGDR